MSVSHVPKNAWMQIERKNGLRKYAESTLRFLLSLYMYVRIFQMTRAAGMSKQKELHKADNLLFSISPPSFHRGITEKVESFVISLLAHEV